VREVRHDIAPIRRVATWPQPIVDSEVAVP
jgi:hypothetical protein